MSFRIIPTQQRDAYMNMALDEACMESVRDGGKPTIRLFEWSKPSITIGRFQCLTDEVDIQAVKEDGIPITRRITGGGAVLHDHEITYSVVAPQELFVSSVRESYGQMVKPLMQALAKLGVETQFRPLNDVVLGTKKISGNAQTRKEGVVLQHGTIIIRLDENKMRRYLTPDKSKVSDKPFTKSDGKVMSDVASYGLTYQQVHDAVREQLITTYQAVEQEWSADELVRAKELAKKYADEAWVALR